VFEGAPPRWTGEWQGLVFVVALSPVWELVQVTAAAAAARERAAPAA